MLRLRALAALVGLVALTTAGSLATPTCAYACSCVPPRSIAEYRGDPDYAILVGRVVAIDASQRGQFAVDRWFQGGSAPIVPIQGGQGADCGLPLRAGQQLVLVAFVEAGQQIIHAGVCSPSGDLSTADGQKVLQDVVTAFGAGTPVDGEGPNAPGLPVAGIAVGGVALLLLVGAVMLVARRERT